MITVIGTVKVSVKVKPGSYGSDAGREESDIRTACLGGGFGIATNLAAMGRKTALISAVGDDILGRAALEELKAAGVDTEGVAIAKGATPVEVEILNILGDAEFTGCSHGLTEAVSPEVIGSCRELIGASDILVIDGNIPERSVERAVDICGEMGEKMIFFDPGSCEGSNRAEGLLGSFYGIMPSRAEAEAMTGASILSEDELMEAGRTLTERGVSRIIITMKGGGLYYKEGMREGILRPDRVLSFADTSGAGDVVSAAVVSAAAGGMDIESTAKEAMARAAAFLSALEDEKPI